MKLMKKVLALALSGVMALSVVPTITPAITAEAAAADTKLTPTVSINLLAPETNLTVPENDSPADQIVKLSGASDIAAAYGGVSVLVEVEDTSLLLARATDSAGKIGNTASNGETKYVDAAKGWSSGSDRVEFADPDTGVVEVTDNALVGLYALKAGKTNLLISMVNKQDTKLYTQTIPVVIEERAKTITASISTNAAASTLKTTTDPNELSMKLSQKSKTTVLSLVDKTGGTHTKTDVTAWTASSADEKIVKVTAGAGGDNDNDDTITLQAVGVGTTTVTVGGMNAGKATGHTYKLTVTVAVDTEAITAKIGTDTKTEYTKAGNTGASGTLTSAAVGTAKVTTAATTLPTNIIKLDNVSTKTTKINATSAMGGILTYTLYDMAAVDGTVNAVTGANPISVDNQGNITVVNDAKFGANGHAYALLVISSNKASAKSDATYVAGTDDLTFFFDVSNKELTNVKVQNSAGAALKSGDTIKLSVKDKTSDTIVVSSNAGENFITSTVADTSVATYAAGTITAVKVGKTSITFKATNSASTEGEATFTLNVEVVNTNISNPITITSPADGVLTLSESVPTGKIEASTAYKNVLTYTLKTKAADGTYADYTGADLSVNASSGEVTYKKTGNSGTAYVEITGKENAEAEAPTTAYVTVVYGARKAASDLAIGAIKLTVKVGETVSAGATSTQTLAYKSADESIASVSNTGEIKGVKAGTTAITVTALEDDKFELGEKTIAVEVVADAAVAKKAVTFKNTSKTYKVKTLKKAKKTYSVIKASNGGKVTYKVTKGTKKYITVSTKGKVTVKKGAKKGTYKVKVTVAAKGNYKKTSKTITISVK